MVAEAVLARALGFVDGVGKDGGEEGDGPGRDAEGEDARVEAVPVGRDEEVDGREGGEVGRQEKGERGRRVEDDGVGVEPAVWARGRLVRGGWSRGSRYVQHPLEALFLGLLELGDDDGEEVGGLGPRTLGATVMVILGQRADGLTRGRELGVAVARIVSVVGLERAMDDVSLELVGSDGNFCDSGSQLSGRRLGE